MSDISTIEPTSIRAGDGASWRRLLPGYLASAGWTLRYRLLWATPSPASFSATADGDGHLIQLTAAATASWQAGKATLVGWVEAAGGQRITLLQQPMEVLPDLTTAVTLDGRTDAQRRLADAEAALDAYLAAGQGHVAEYTINGRHMVFRSARELRELVDAARRDVARERILAAAAQGVSAGRIYTRF